MAEVGTRKLYEDDHVVVWQLELKPGEAGDLHTHTRDYVVRILSGSTVEVFGPDDESLYTVDVPTGSTVNFKMDGNRVVSDRPGSQPIPATHRARNVGNSKFSEVLIEFKGIEDGPPHG